MTTQNEATQKKAKRTKWTKEKCANVAKDYTNRSVFHKNEQSAYQAARRLGVLDEICAHMTIEKRGRKAKKKEAVSEPVQKEVAVASY